MKDASPRTVYRRDYRPPDFLIETTALRFELADTATLVQSRLRLRRNHQGNRPLVLDGTDLEMVALLLDGLAVPASGYVIDGEQLTLASVPDVFELEVTTRINPQGNTALEGLYISGGAFCTQCEAEGFRRITWYLDRPDVMARFTTTIVADPTRCPVMLSNGNPIAESELADGRRSVTWEDPFPKPAYLFALVAGDLACVEERFVTASGRSVQLRLYVEHGNDDKCDHALASLANAMRWDEQVFGLEYDLDIYMVVAVSDFNMGAMENKGLNVFNTRYVLARGETATDSDYRAIEGVIGHEYFHNWTGNRVTCRDWFQLSLKEGLTVFRDQEFSADMGSRAVNRIDEVRLLRASQFLEDAGPMAHPVRPDSYMEINNFYTTTVYNKGAEVVRMIHTLVGADGFRRGMDRYFERHDGQAVTCDDFVAAMEDANEADLRQFRRWYSQAGTSLLRIDMAYDGDSGDCVLDVAQRCPPTPGQAEKAPQHIPLAVALLDATGREMPLTLDGESAPGAGTRVLEIREAHQQFRFVNVPVRPVPSLLRNFSAPVKLEYDYSDTELEFLLAYDSDEFSRWEAGQQLAVKVILRQVEALASGREPQLHQGLADSLRAVLLSEAVDGELIALILNLPSEGYLGEFMDTVNVEGIHLAREFLLSALAGALESELMQTYHRCAPSDGYRLDSESVARRALRNRCLQLLMSLDDSGHRALCVRQFESADNMTDSIAALALLADSDAGERESALGSFEQRWRHDALVMDKWFSVQATSKRADTFERVRELMSHPLFNLTNPNKVRALVGAFCAHNLTAFHHRSGQGYRFLADQIIALDAVNPQVAARMTQPFTTWKRYDTQRQDLVRGQLERILAVSGLSRDVFEMVSKTLGKT